MRVPRSRSGGGLLGDQIVEVDIADTQCEPVFVGGGQCQQILDQIPHALGFRQQCRLDQLRIQGFGAVAGQFQRGGDGRQWTTQFMRGVAHETTLRAMTRLDSDQHLVHRFGQPRDLVAGRRDRHPPRQVAGLDSRYPGPDLFHRPQ